MNLVLRIPREKNRSGLNTGKGLNSEALFPAACGFLPLKIAGAAARILNCEISSLVPVLNMPAVIVSPGCQS